MIIFFQDEGDIDNHYSQDSEISFGTCSSRLAVRNDDQIIRLCVSAAYFNPLTQLLDVGLLGVRPLLSCETLLKSVRITVEQVILYYFLNLFVVFFIGYDKSCIERCKVVGF